MPETPQPHYNDIRTAGRDLAGAHAAILLEIERHGHREHARRTAHHERMEANRKLEPPGGDHAGRM